MKKTTYAYVFFNTIAIGARHTNLLQTFIIQPLASVSPEKERPSFLLHHFNTKGD